MEGSRALFKRWISIHNVTQHTWIRAYVLNNDQIKMLSLNSKWVVPIQGKPAYEDLINFLSWLYTSTRDGVIEVNKMKAAWSQKKYRDSLKSKDKLAQNFVMSKEIIVRLQYIAKIKRQTKNLTIEQLIFDEYERIINLVNETTKGYPKPKPPYPNQNSDIANNQVSSLFNDATHSTLPFSVRNSPLAKAFENGQKINAKQAALQASIANLSHHKGSAIKGRNQHLERLKNRTR